MSDGTEKKLTPNEESLQRCLHLVELDANLRLLPNDSILADNIRDQMGDLWKGMLKRHQDTCDRIATARGLYELLDEQYRTHLADGFDKEDSDG